jgi:hypothetical protein
MRLTHHLVAVAAALASASQAGDRQYVDPGGRFRFSYPAGFGATSAGTDSGFGDRVAAVRFQRFSSGVPPAGGAPVQGGEAVLTRGFPVIDLQAVGGLYDSIATQIFTRPIREMVMSVLPPLTPASFCTEIAREYHIDVGLPVFASLSAQQKASIQAVDALRHENPRVLSCSRDGTIVTFHEEVRSSGGPIQHVYGAVRFLTGDYSTFQLIRGGPLPPPGTLEAMTGVVKSWTDLR